MWWQYLETRAMKGFFLLVLLIIHEGWSSSITRNSDFGVYGQNDTDSKHKLSRKKRFLLFPVGASILFTASGAKALIFKGPGGNFVILELDMYYPLPDYKNRFTSFKVGEIAMKPMSSKPELPPTPPPQPTPPHPTPATAELHDHHSGNEVSHMELQDYLKAHPDTYVPPGYGKDRSDWLQPGTYNPYQNYYKQSMVYKPSYSSNVAQDYQPYKSKLWGYTPSEPYHSNIYRMKRAMDEFIDDEIEEEEDRFNISHHRNWEHFYHYREKRDLYHTLEHAFGESYRFQMKACVMRAICEARSFLLPSGRSMMMDILRIAFTVPLKDDLNDEYSTAMREQNLDCHALYDKDCSVSILYLVLFGKFVS